MRRHFGTDGIRAKVGREPMTPDYILRLGYAIGKVIAVHSPTGTPNVLVSKDTRLSGYMVESALEAGISAAGVDVTLSGPLPTSGVSYLTRALRMSAGIMISASHNTYEDNGIKIFGPDGRKLSDSIEDSIEGAVSGLGALSFDTDPGKAMRIKESSGRYIEFCKGTFPQDLDLFGLKLVVDCANGAAYQVAPAVFHELGADVVAINDRPDGRNINVRSGVMNPASACAKVREVSADLGVVLDGDADRLHVVDRNGRLHDGDALLYVLVDNGPEGVAGVAGTLMTNLALETHIRKLGIGFARAPVGDRYVSDELQRRGWQLGGESSGHILMLDRHVTGDGIVTALQALAIMRRTGKPFDVLAAPYQPVPQMLRSVPVADKKAAMAHGALLSRIGEVEAELGDKGRILVRPSGTEEKIRILVESAMEPAHMERIVSSVADVIREGWR